jgi:hypothetical protein
LCRFAGFLSTGKLAFTCESGTTATPSVGAELIATPTAPYPWSIRICTNTPPAECPMRIGWRVDRPDNGSEVLDDGGYGDFLDRRRVGVERLDLGLEARVRRREDAEALPLVVVDPVLPASWGHPEAVDEHDGVRPVSGHDFPPTAQP